MMGRKNNLQAKKKPTDMVLHKTFRGTKTTPVPPSNKGLAHKMRTLSVSITDIRKDNSLHNLGLIDQGHGVFRICTTRTPTRYHRQIRMKGNQEEISSAKRSNKNEILMKGNVGGPKNVTDGIDKNDVAQNDVKQTSAFGGGKNPIGRRGSGGYKSVTDGIDKNYAARNDVKQTSALKNGEKPSGVRGGRRTIVSGLLSATNGIGENYVTLNDGKMTTRRSSSNDKALVIDIANSDEENVSVCEHNIRMGYRKKVSFLQSDESVGRKVLNRTKNKTTDIQVEIETKSTPELRSRNSSRQPQNGLPNENGLNLRVKKNSEVSPVNGQISNSPSPLDLNDFNKSPKVLIKRLASPLKSNVQHLQSRVKSTVSRVLVGKDKDLCSPQKDDEGHSKLEIKKYGLRSLTPSENRNSTKMKQEISDPLTFGHASDHVKRPQLQNVRSERSRKVATVSSQPSSPEKKKKISVIMKKSPRKLRNSVPNQNDKNDLNFKASSSAVAEDKALPKMKLTRKLNNTFQMQWCGVCGVELHSLDNKLEHEFSHQEPRKLTVSLHCCLLNHSSVKLPVYVSSEELAAIPDPQEDTLSAVANDDDFHLLLSVDDVLNNDEENAYESLASSDDECGVVKAERTSADASTQYSPQNVPNRVALVEAATPKRFSPDKSSKSMESRERSKRKSHSKMRLWEGSPVTRSGRVVKITEKTRDCIEQSACARLLFSENEVEDIGASNTQVTGEVSLIEERLMEEESASEEKLIPPVDEYVEVVAMKGDMEDIIASGATDLETVIDKAPEDDVSASRMDLPPANEINPCIPHLEENSILNTVETVSVDINKKGMFIETKEMNSDQKENDKSCILPENTLGGEEVKYMAIESEDTECGHNALLDVNQTLIHNMDSDETSEKLMDSQEVNTIENDWDSEVSVKLGEALQSDDYNELNVLNENAQESKASELSVIKIKPTDSSAKAGEDLEDETGSSINKDKVVPLETREVDKPNEKDKACISSGNMVSGIKDLEILVYKDVQENIFNTVPNVSQTLKQKAEPDETLEEQTGSLESGTLEKVQKDEVSISLGDGALPSDDFNEQKVLSGSIEKSKVLEAAVEKITQSNPILEESEHIDNKALVSPDSSIAREKAFPVEIKEVDEQNEKDKACILQRNMQCKVDDLEKIISKDDVKGSGFNTVLNVSQTLRLKPESDETLKEQTGSLASSSIENIQENEISLKLDDALSSDGISAQKVVGDIINESKVSESGISETTDRMLGKKMGTEEIIEDVIDDNSKDIMLVDESNDVLVGGTPTENVEMQESSESEYVSVKNIIDASSFNLSEEQELEDISDDEWEDMSDRMEQSPQYISGHHGDVEMDEGPDSCVDNVGQEGEMDLEENEKGTGLPDPMCTGGVVSEAMEQEMKDLENEDEIMAENVVDEMVGVLSPKNNDIIVEGGGLAAEVDMLEAAEDPEDGSMAEVIDTTQEEQPEVPGKALIELGEKESTGREALAEGESSGVVDLDSLKEGKGVENESLNHSQGENCVRNNDTVEEVGGEVPEKLKMPLNGIELVAVEETGDEKGSDKQCGQKDEVSVDSLNMTNKHSATSKNIAVKQVTLGDGEELNGSN